MIELPDGSLEKLLGELYGEATVLYHSGLLVEAAQKYEEILKLAPDASDAWRGLGMVYYR